MLVSLLGEGRTAEGKLIKRVANGVVGMDRDERPLRRNWYREEVYHMFLEFQIPLFSNEPDALPNPDLIPG